MFKISGDSNSFSFKIYEDKFIDESILRMEIFVHDNEEEFHKDEFENYIEKIKLCSDKDEKKINTYSIILNLLIIEKDKLEQSENKRNISPVEIFPKFSIIRDLGDGRIEYKGEKVISWNTFVTFVNKLQE